MIKPADVLNNIEQSVQKCNHTEGLEKVITANVFARGDRACLLTVKRNDRGLMTEVKLYFVQLFLTFDSKPIVSHLILNNVISIDADPKIISHFDITHTFIRQPIPFSDQFVQRMLRMGSLIEDNRLYLTHPYYSAEYDFQGAILAYEFDESINEWSFTLILPTTPLKGDSFGYNLAISPDGKIIAVSSLVTPDGVNEAGMVHLFNWETTVKDGAKCTQYKEFASMTQYTADDHFGEYITFLDDTCLEVRGTHSGITVYEIDRSKWEITELAKEEK